MALVVIARAMAARSWLRTCSRIRFRLRKYIETCSSEEISENVRRTQAHVRGYITPCSRFLTPPRTTTDCLFRPPLLCFNSPFSMRKCRHRSLLSGSPVTIV
jgi:hypothetical protein